MTAVGVAALDANVLVPIVACDFLLTAFDHGLFEPVVSVTVLDEVEHTLLEDFRHIDPDGLRRRVAHLRVAPADQVLDTAGATGPEAVNAKYRHVVAAALAGEAHFVVTEDARLRTEVAAAGLGVEPLDGDAFAMRLWAAAPDVVDQTVRQLIASAKGASALGHSAVTFRPAWALCDRGTPGLEQARSLRPGAPSASARGREQRPSSTGRPTCATSTAPSGGQRCARSASPRWSSCAGAA